MSLPDVEAMAVAFLKPFVAPVKVATKVANPRPLESVRVFRSGGAALNRVLEEAQLTVEVEAVTDVRALELALLCREGFLHDSRLMLLVRGVNEVGGLYFAPDPETNIPRYRFTVALLVRSGRS